MELRDRIGYDAGTTRLEDALVTAAEHAFNYLAACPRNNVLNDNRLQQS